MLLVFLMCFYCFFISFIVFFSVFFLVLSGQAMALSGGGRERVGTQLGAAVQFIAFGWVGGESWKNVGPCKNEEYYMNYK